MVNFPSHTSNKNVPPSAFALLLCEWSQMSGEIITTTYATNTGHIYQVTDWNNNKPREVQITDIAREMGYAPVVIMARIVKFSDIAARLESEAVA